MFCLIIILDESHELIPSDHNFSTPSIVIDTCEDSNDVEIDENLRKKLIRPKYVQTKRPLYDQANERIWLEEKLL